MVALPRVKSGAGWRTADTRGLRMALPSLPIMTPAATAASKEAGFPVHRLWERKLPSRHSVRFVASLLTCLHCLSGALNFLAFYTYNIVHESFHDLTTPHLPIN